AGPKTPAQADDLLPAFRAKIWTIIREEQQVFEVPFPPVARIIGHPPRKQPILARLRPKSARLKNSEWAGILCRPIFPCVTENISNPFCLLHFCRYLQRRSRLRKSTMSYALKRRWCS